MEKLHKDLSEKHGWYAEWHKIQYITFLHFFFLIGISSLVAWSVLQGIEADDRSYVAAVVSSSKASGASLGDLTKELLSLTKQYERAESEEEKAAIGTALTSIVMERKAKLLSLADLDPQSFLINALPAGIAKRLPDSVQAFIEKETELEGELSVIHVDPLPEDHPDHAHSHEDMLYELAVTNGSGKGHVKVQYGKFAPDRLETGMKVKIKGTKLDDELVAVEAAGGSTGTTVLSEPNVAAPTLKKVLVVLFNFTNNTTQPFTTTQIAGTVFNNSNSTNLFYQETSFDQIALEGDVVGWYTIPYTNENCDSMLTEWTSAADEAVLAAGVPLADYPHRIYVWNTNAGCSFGGRGTVGGTITKAWIPGYNTPEIFAHEFGHNLRARHAQWLKCGSLAVDVYSNCTLDEYGDRSDVMGYAWGNGYVQFNGARKIGEVWLSTTPHMQTVTTSGSYDITASEFNDSSVKVLNIAKPNTNEQYYVFYRQPFGFDSKLPTPFINGATINIWNGSILSQTKLVDTTPGDGNWSNAPLSDGGSFSDPANGITITQIAHSATTTTLNVTFTGPECSRMAPSITASPLTQTAGATQPLTYSVTVKNNDTSVCSNATFALSGSVPSAWAQTVTPGSITLAPGASGTATFTVTSASSTADGAYPVAVQVADSAVPVHSGSVSMSYVVYTPPADTTPPTVSITSPANGTKLKGNTNVNIAVTASDGSGIASIALVIDGTTVKTCTNTTTCSYTWSGKSIKAGTHTIVATATDKAGNQKSATVTVTK